MSLPKPRAVLQPVPTMARSEVRQSKTTMRLNTVVIFGPGVTDCVWFIKAYHSTPPDRPSLWGVTLPRIILGNSCANGFAHEPGSLLGRASARKGGAGAGAALTPRSVAIGHAATGASGGCRVRILPRISGRMPGKFVAVQKEGSRRTGPLRVWGLRIPGLTVHFLCPCHAGRRRLPGRWSCCSTHRQPRG